MADLNQRITATAILEPAVQKNWQVFLKRSLDVILVLLTLPLWLPVIFLLGGLVKFGDLGPMFYRRRVAGVAEDFDAFKLRSMRVDADQWLSRHPDLLKAFQKNFKLKDDPRVTRLGRFLRRYSLDELPQLFNVLKGQMSLVGPRMISPPEIEKYGLYRRLIFSVKPGLTGYWQVSSWQEVSYEERVKMDVFYVQNWSLWLDLKILVKTVWKVLRREGAY